MASAIRSFSADFLEKMAAQGMQQEFCDAWIGLYERFCAGETGFIPESSIEPVEELPELASLPEGDESLLARTVVLKLNGGLGTSMGLDKAKSLLELKNGETFLDLIAKQILKLRERHPVRFMLMNSFSTEDDTREFFKKYPEIFQAWDSEVSFLQNMAPKVDAATLQPVSWPSKPGCEWCPPGHGDIYAALAGSGKLDRLLEEGYEYVFVSNSDNLGATLDTRLLGYLASSGAPMLMEVCVRGEDDKKGGHLARERGTGILTLRESAQCPRADEKDFQDVSKHKFFNTNNLWLNLRHLKDAMLGGVLQLPLIVNEKRVDPASKEDPGPKVYQLETAMGAAISSLPGSAAICVPFDRFAPVKTCSQLFSLRSDAYVISPDFKPVLVPGAAKPIVDFDDNYKMVPDMEAAIPHGVPSLRHCGKLTVRGKVIFGPGVVFEGEVAILNGDTSGPVPTVVGTIRGSTDKLRILRDADDVQSHVAGAFPARGFGSYAAAAPWAVAGPPLGLGTVRTMVPAGMLPSGVPLGSTMRGYTVAAPPVVTAAPPKAVTLAAPHIITTGAALPWGFTQGPAPRYVYAVQPQVPAAVPAPAGH